MSEAADRNLADLTRWIDDSTDYDIGVQDCADRIGYARHHLQRIFKARYGTTLGKYLQARRLAHGAILISSGHSVTDAAIASGYECVQSFCRAFKKEKGYRAYDLHEKHE